MTRFYEYDNFINVFAIGGCDNMPEVVEKQKGKKRWLISIKNPARIWILPIIGILYFLWFVAIFVVPTFLNVPKEWPFLEMGLYADDGSMLWISWVGIGIILYAVLFVMELLLIISWKKKLEEERQKQVMFEQLLEEVPEASINEQKWIEPEKIKGKTVAGFAYPLNLEGGVYGNALVDIDEQNVLKLRSLMAKPCCVCKDRMICWDSYKDKMRYNYFLSNVDCKAGLDSIAMGDVAPMKRPDAGAWKPDQPKQEIKTGGERSASAYMIPETEAAPRKYPKIYVDIERIEGIGPIRAKALREAGIKSTDDLEDADIEKLAEKTWIPERLLGGWKAMAELMHVEDVGQQFSEALVRSGVKSVEQLAASDPAKLAAKIRQIIASMGKRITQASITDSRVAAWVENAKKLLKQAAIRAG